MANGLVERFNSTLKTCLRRLCSEQPRQWHRFINPLLFAYREIPQESTHFAPFELLYGRSVRGPMHILRELWTKDIQEDEVKSSYEYVLDLRSRIDETLKLAQDELLKSQTKQKKYYDRKAKQRTMCVGDKVLVLLPTDSNKLLMQWKGPFSVVARVGVCDYRIDMDGREKTFHANLLKQYISRDSTVPDLDEDSQPMIAACLAVIDDSDETESEDLPELGTWGSKESSKDLEFGTNLSPDQVDELKNITTRHRAIFTDMPGSTTLGEHKIELTSTTPLRQRAYPVPYALRQSLRDEIQEMEAMGIVRKSSSPYAAPVVVVKKKDGSNRVCVDYRRLNKVTVFDPQPMVPPADVFQNMERDKFFSKIDLSRGFWQIPVREKDIPKTAFVTMDGHYEFLRMPFGMMNSGATLTRAVLKMIDGMNNVEAYIDDLLVHTETWDEHLNVLNELFKRLEDANLTVRPSKCLLGSSTIEFLGHTLGEGKISLQDDNVAKIKDAPRPTNKKQVRSFLGLVGYYKEFVPNFSAIASPLSDLLRKGQPNVVNWDDAQEKAYLSLKNAITSKPVLHLPDVNRQFILRTDASDRGLGAALLQEFDNQLFPVAYASKKLNDRETKYSTIEKESFAIIWGIQKFALYLHSVKFILQTDHSPLQYLNQAKFNSPRLMRWALALQGYTFDVQYIKGSENVGADFLSRIDV